MYIPARRSAVHLLRPWLRTLAGRAGGDDNVVTQATTRAPPADSEHQGEQARTEDPAADADPAQRKPPPDWYKRGVWIDPGIIETRMRDDDPPEQAVEKEPETPVSKSLSAMIKVCDASSGTCSLVMHAAAPASHCSSAVNMVNCRSVRDRIRTALDLTRAFGQAPVQSRTVLQTAALQYRGGPVSVADYMREVLANPMGGFYAAQGGEAIGARGHFVTAPEVHPMFAEVRPSRSTLACDELLFLEWLRGMRSAALSQSRTLTRRPRRIVRVNCHAQPCRCPASGSHSRCCWDSARAAHRNAMQTIAAWLLHNYQEVLRSPAKVALVELGPGRGTLMAQMLQALAMMPGGRALLAASEVHFVEVSDDLRGEQLRALKCSRPVRASEVRRHAPGMSGPANTRCRWSE